MTDKAREEFEAWAKTQEWTIDLLYRDGYVAWEAQFAFDAWQASRAAIVIELPKRADDGLDGLDAGGWPKDSSAHRVNCAIAQCAMAIGAAGLKVKS